MRLRAHINKKWSAFVIVVVIVIVIDFFDYDYDHNYDSFKGMVQKRAVYLYKFAAIAVRCKCTAETRNPLKAG